MTPIEDDELRGMLEERGGRHAIDLRSVVDVARRDAIEAGRVRRPRFVMGLRPILAGLGSVVAIALVVVLVVVPLSVRPSASAGPNAGPSPSVAPSASEAVPSPSLDVGLAKVEALTADGLAAWLTTAGTSAKGWVVLFQGELIADPSVDCAANRSDCPTTVVRGAPQSIVVEPVGDIGPGPWDGSGPLTGLFALRGTGRTWAGTAPVMEFLATVRSPSGRFCGRTADCHGSLEWPVGGLLATAPPDGPNWYLVTAWIVRTPLHPCPSLVNPPTSEYGCPSDDFLAQDRIQPTRIDGSSQVPAGVLYLPAGSYDRYAPEPAAYPAPDGMGVVPRVATFLLQRILVPPCGPLADCSVSPKDRHWIMRARVDPIEGTATPTPTPTLPGAPAGDRYPGGIPRVIGDEPVLVGLDAQARWRDATDATTFLVGGWFDSRSNLFCSGARAPGPWRHPLRDLPGDVPGRHRSEAGDRGVSRHPDTGVVVPRLGGHPDQGRALSGDVVSSTNRSSQERGDAADRGGARPVRQRPFPGGTKSERTSVVIAPECSDRSFGETTTRVHRQSVPGRNAVTRLIEALGMSDSVRFLEEPGRDERAWSSPHMSSTGSGRPTR